MGPQYIEYSIPAHGKNKPSGTSETIFALAYIHRELARMLLFGCATVPPLHMRIPLLTENTKMMTSTMILPLCTLLVILASAGIHGYEITTTHNLGNLKSHTYSLDVVLKVKVFNRFNFYGFIDVKFIIFSNSIWHNNFCLEFLFTL